MYHPQQPRAVEMSLNMSSQPQGFSVYQETLGATLIFFPAIGTPELDLLIDAYVPGPVSAKEKRATVSLDFFQHLGTTGQNFKFYAVDPVALSALSSSPESFDMSPTLSDVTSWSFASLPSAPSAPSTPSAAAAAAPAARHKSRPAKRLASSKPAVVDVSSLPGMKILTKDGRDVTNSASKGCKTKEQRDHAHLMRIIKACDSCKRKKVRCDPSHKKRAAASQSPAHTKSAKKARTLLESPVAPQAPAAVDPWVFPMELAMAPTPVEDEDWAQFFQFGDDHSDNIDPFMSPEHLFSPIDPSTSSSASASALSASSESSSSSSPMPQPLTPVHAPHGQQSNLQELDIFQVGGDYVDFNLYSPQSNILDEEPIMLKSVPVSAYKSSIALPSVSSGDGGIALPSVASGVGIALPPVSSDVGTDLSPVSSEGGIDLPSHSAPERTKDLANLQSVLYICRQNSVEKTNCAQFHAGTHETASPLAHDHSTRVNISPTRNSGSTIAATETAAAVMTALRSASTAPIGVPETPVQSASLYEGGVAISAVAIDDGVVDEQQSPAALPVASIGTWGQDNDVVDSRWSAQGSATLAAVSEDTKSVALTRIGSAFHIAAVGFRLVSMRGEESYGGALSVLAAVTVLGLIGAILTHKAGSVKKPQRGSFGLVDNGGAMRTATHIAHACTPPRSSKPAPEGLSSCSRDSFPGDWLNGKMRRVMCLARGMGSLGKISQFGGRRDSGGKEALLWR